jgi:DNA-directed RNA polymerase specialized sigma24 family protein
MSAMNATHVKRLLIGCTPALQRYVRRRVGDSDTTDEIVQEVSLRALEGLGPGDPKSFVAWCYGIARHVIGIEWRRRRRARAELSLEDPSVGGIHDPMAGPDRVVDARVSLRRALGNSESAALLVRHFAANGSGKDLALELGVTPTALRMRMMRLRSSARARLGAL